MKRIFIGIAAAASLLTTSAFAADLAARPYTKAPLPVAAPVYAWTGFYVGLNGGYSWGRTDTTLFAGTALATPLRQDVNGGLFGGQIGYNWQVDPRWVLGLEADGQWTDQHSSRNDFLGTTSLVLAGGDFHIVTTTSAADEWRLPWFATFRGRVGFLADPTLLLYGTGGLAVGEVKFSTQTTVTSQLFLGSTSTTPAGPPVTTVAAASESQTRVGWTLGAGLEKKFTPNWSVKLEYLYIDFGTKTYFGGTANQADVRFHDHIFRAGFNYAFSPTPVVAKY
jgi:outer membrane immunogenic protein